MKLKAVTFCQQFSNGMLLELQTLLYGVIPLPEASVFRESKKEYIYARLPTSSTGGQHILVNILATFGSFSAVSAPLFASKYAFDSIFQDLPDYLAEIFEIW